MNKKIWVFFFLLFISVVPAGAQLDFNQEVIIIPAEHDIQPYKWRTSLNPWIYKPSLKYDKKAVAGNDIEFVFTVQSTTGENLSDMHVFITDTGLNTYRHVMPPFRESQCKFIFKPLRAGKYRFEIVFRAAGEWVQFSKKVKIKGKKQEKISDESLADSGYTVKIKTIPETIYADHVATFIYEISYNDEPIRAVEKINGLDMQVAAWGESLRHFIYATPRQNLGGSEIAVSMVFPSPRKYTVFAEFRHNGAIRKIRHVLDVHEEITNRPGESSFRNNDLFN
jgi:hypothetical protein